MTKALLAALSPKEEGALRRVGAGISMRNFLPAAEVDRLTRLGLVEECEGRVVATEDGRTRLAEIVARPH